MPPITIFRRQPNLGLAVRHIQLSVKTGVSVCSVMEDLS